MTGDDRAPAADRGLGNRPPAGWEEMTVTLDVWDGRSRADGLRLQAARAGIKRVWLQQGAESAEAAAAAAACGVELVAGECILMFAHPASYHRVHRWVRGLVGRLPA